MLLRDMARPVFCVCAIGFVWKMIGYVVPQGNLGSFEGIMLGMSCATLVVAAIELFTERGFDVLRVYQVIFPLITGVFLLPSCPQCRKKAPCLRGPVLQSFPNLTSRAFLRKSKPIRPITLKRSPHVSESRRRRRLRPMRKVSKKRKLRRDLSPHGLRALQ